MADTELPFVSWWPEIDTLAASKLPEDQRRGFSVFRFQAVAGGVLLTGNWPTRAKSRGPSKGEPDFRSCTRRAQRVAVTVEEYRRAVADREARDAAAGMPAEAPF